MIAQWFRQKGAMVQGWFLSLGRRVNEALVAILHRIVINPLLACSDRYQAHSTSHVDASGEALPPWKVEKLAEFHAWLKELPDGDDAGEESLETCDLFTLLSEFTALRQEIRLQNREQSRSVKSVNGFLDAYKEDLESLRQRSAALEDAKEQIIAYAETKSVSPFLDVRAALVRGLDASRELEKSPALLKATRERRQSVVKGYESALSRFDHALALVGVDAIDTVGEPFDPKSMRAVNREEHEGVAPGIVVRETATGFRRNGDVLRYAEVIVSQ